VVTLEIGIKTSGLRQTFRQALQTASRVGATAVEIDVRRELPVAEMSQTAVRQVRKLLADAGLRVCAVGFPTRRGYNVAAELDRRVSATKQALDLAHALGTGIVVNQVGMIPEDDQQDEFALLVEVLTELGRHGQRVGARLAAATGAESGSQLARLLNALPEGCLAVDFDPGSLIVNGHSPLDAMDALGSHVIHVHATDGTRDLARGRGSEVELGRGSVDFPAVLGALEDHAYRGYLTVARDSAVEPVTEFGNAVEFLKRIQLG
jgi:sugar phosphate isomerase/epimerase